MTQETKVYPPNLKVEFKKGEPAGPRKVKTVPKQLQDASGNWGDNPNGATKSEAVGVNLMDVVLAFPDAMKKDGKFPTTPFPPGFSIQWRMFIVGPNAVDEDGDRLTKMPLPTEVSWTDRTSEAWMYDRMTKTIRTALEANPGTGIRDHVFSFGKAAGPTPNGMWAFSHKGLLKALYPTIVIPAGGSKGGAGAVKDRSGPSAAVLAALPTGAKLPTRNEEPLAPMAQAVTPPTTVNPFQAANVAPAAPQGPPAGFVASAQAQRIADLLKGHLTSQGLTVSKVCELHGITPELMLRNAFTKGGAKDPTSGTPLSIPEAEAAIIAKYPQLVGITV